MVYYPPEKYIGGCHCGAVAYEVELDLENAKIMSCNCSHCHMVGWYLTFVPASQFTLLKGEDNLTDYRFNTNKIAHLFCKTCGVKSFARGKDKDGGETAAINVRCLEGVDTDKLTITKVNGKDF